MPRIAAERAAKQRQRLVLGHAAAGLVGQRDHAVDIGKIRQRIVAGERILLEDVGDHAGDMGAAIHRGEDADVVAGRDAAIGTADAFEGRGQIEIRRRRDVDAESIILGEIAHAAILGMDMLARRDRHRRKADDLAVAADRLAHRDRPDRHLVAGRNPLDRGDAVGHHHARRQAGARDQHAIIGMQADDGCCGHGTSPWLIAVARSSEWRACELGEGRGLTHSRIRPTSPLRSCRARSYALPPESLRVWLTCILA